MNTLVDGRPIFSKALVSHLAAAPDMASMSMISPQQFDIFHAHIVAVLFCGQGSAVVDIPAILSIWGGGNPLPFPDHQLDRLAGTNSLSDSKKVDDLIYLLLLCLLLSPVPVSLMLP
jgi:hypothetical protein